MEIYFLGAISGLTKHRKDYELIVKLLENKGHKVQSDHILERDPKRPETFKIKDDALYFKITMDRIKHADMMLAEISFPTVNIGYEISYALENKVPVLALYNNTKKGKMSPLLIGNNSEHLIVSAYNYSNIEDLLNEKINEIELLFNTRFSLPLSTQIIEYLNWLSSRTGLSKSKLVKSFVEDRIRSDSQYQKFIAELKK